MTRTEFEDRTLVTNVSNYEFDAIHAVYMASDLDKDEFCKMWCKMNASRVARAKAEAKKAQEIAELKDQVAGIIAKRYLPTFDWRKDAIDNLSNREIGILARIGIQVDAPKDPYGVTFHRTTIDVWYDMDRFIANK